MPPQPDGATADRATEPRKKDDRGGGVGRAAEFAPEERSADGVGGEAADALRGEGDERDRRESPDARAPRAVVRR